MRIISKVATLAAIAYKTSIGELALRCRSGCMIMRVMSCAWLHTSCGRCWLWPGVLHQTLLAQLFSFSQDQTSRPARLSPAGAAERCWGSGLAQLQCTSKERALGC